MRAFTDLPANVRIRELREDGGVFSMLHRNARLRIIASFGGGWDHVSVSIFHRCPGWAEMEAVKRAFFADDEVAMQLHVPPADHVNIHPNCLHLWRPQNQPIPLPPTLFV
jgi:hypothetical protein